MLGYVLVVLYSDGKLIGNLSKIVPKSNQGNKKLILTFFLLFTKLMKCKEEEAGCYHFRESSICSS